MSVYVIPRGSDEARMFVKVRNSLLSNTLVIIQLYIVIHKLLFI